MSPANGQLKVYATGMRQPWQIVFPPGSHTPLVSDLGQDKGLANPPDFVLRVHQGDNYGFPTCTWATPGACGGFTKPFAQFAPHEDIMGLAVVGGRLYMSSFGEPGGKGPGGEVLSMPLTGGKAVPFVTGFVAPVVGLGQNRGSLYIGELTGQVFKVTP